MDVKESAKTTPRPVGFHQDWAGAGEAGIAVKLEGRVG